MIVYIYILNMYVLVHSSPLVLISYTAEKSTPIIHLLAHNEKLSWKTSERTKTDQFYIPNGELTIIDKQL